MTPFSMLLHAGGFPPREAARILEVREDTVRQWIKGRREPPIDALIAMATYVAHQVSVADEVIEQVVQDTQDSVELGIATDDAEAQSLGWPSALAQHRVIGRITAELIIEGIEVTVVPRGSTAISASAADAHDKYLTRRRDQ